jgi:pyruvate,orthophosphate dikinase
MFFDADRIPAVREMILADKAPPRKALEKAAADAASGFREIFRIMAGLPVTIRLLDPPLHEFLPHTDEDIAERRQAVRHVG